MVARNITEIQVVVCNLMFRYFFDSYNIQSKSVQLTHDMERNLNTKLRVLTPKCHVNIKKSSFPYICCGKSNINRANAHMLSHGECVV